MKRLPGTLPFQDGIAHKVVVGLLDEGAEAAYPQMPFHPQEAYPEYRLGQTSSSPNRAYDVLRQMLYGLELDHGNYGTKSWNPLGNLIHPGNTVLIKPNFVSDRRHSKNSDPENDWQVLTTHPSVIRPIVDYALIALQGSGKVLVADAPQTETDFDNLVTRSGMKALADYYAQVAMPVELLDLRKYFYDLGPKREYIFFDRRKLKGDPLGYVRVDLASDSMFQGVPHKTIRRFIGASQDRFELRRYHKNGHHRYDICASVLNADVIISMPKLKTHKKIGVTLNYKNMVGIVGHKNCIPHYDVADEFDHHPWWKRFILRTLLADVMLGVGGRYRCTAWFSRRVHNLLRTLLAARSSRPQPASACATSATGNTEHNDVIWRSVIDLNRILLYADAGGKLHDTPQRRYFSVVDGITAGERDGPLNPTPTYAGLLCAGADPWAVDAVCAEMMGFDHQKLPILNHIRGLESRLLTSTESASEVEVVLASAGRQCSIHDVVSEFGRHLRAPAGWPSLSRRR